MKFIAIAHCEECNGTQFEMRKICEGETEKDVIVQETMLHDGYGWDLGTFEVKCINCHKKDGIKIKLS